MLILAEKKIIKEFDIFTVQAAFLVARGSLNAWMWHGRVSDTGKTDTYTLLDQDTWTVVWQTSVTAKNLQSDTYTMLWHMEGGMTVADIGWHSSHLHADRTHGRWCDSVTDTGWHSLHLHVDRTHGRCNTVTDTGWHSDTTRWQDTWKVVWQCECHRVALWHLHVDRTHGRWCDSVTDTGRHCPALLGHMESGPLWQWGREECDMNTYAQKVVCDSGPHLVNRSLHTAMWSAAIDRVADTWHQYLHVASICMCVCVCVRACSSVRMYMCVRLCMCAHVWAYMHMCLSPCMCVYVFQWMHVCIYICLSPCMCAYMCIWVYACVCVWVGLRKSVAT